MLSLQNGINTIDVFANPVFEKNRSLEPLNGAVYISPFSKASWLIDPKKNDYISSLVMGNYHEIFKDKGEFILCLEVNVRNSQCGNWAKHSFNLPQLKGEFPRYLPFEYFLGKKVGDSIEIICKENGNHFTLTCRQENFEQVVEEMFMLAYYELSDKYQKGALSPEDQKKWLIISGTKESHFPNSTIENKKI